MTTRYFLYLLLLAAVSGYGQQVEIVQKGNTLNIYWNKKERLTNGETYPVFKPGYTITDDVVLIKIVTGDTHFAGSGTAGLFFDDIDHYTKGIAIWRYKPWNSWTKPLKMAAGSEMPENDVQLYYWQYADGLYGAAVPLSGNGFRTTLGSEGKKWGSKSESYADNKNADTIPAMAIAFGSDPFELFERIYRTALRSMGKGENLRVEKKFPETFNYIGWCTWNASQNGTNLNESLLLNAARSFSEHHFPIGWILVDDGWFQQHDRKLQSYAPDPVKFPNGFKPVIDKLKKDYGIKYMGVWHTFNGLWNGIDPSSSLGKRFAPALFSWNQKESPDKPDGPNKTYYFLKPDSDSLNIFYNEWHQYLKSEGFDFIKVDNQLVVEKMAVNNYPIFTLSDSMHKALYRSTDKYFNGSIINCMDMTADAYLNFGHSAVARSEEDYFPYEPDESYNLQRGNAAAHVLQAVYNSIYFGQMVYPDFDIFQSHNPNAVYHAIARAINCGPIYITDNIGEQKFDVLRPLVYADGRIIKSETPLLPTEDCLFQVQDAKLFKACSVVRDAGLLGAWNAADADAVQGTIQPGDVRNIEGKVFLVYEHFSGSWKKLERKESFPLSLKRMGFKLYYVVPVKSGFAPLGLTEKYNGPATILKEEWGKNRVMISLYEGGIFKAYCSKRPSNILLNGKAIHDFTLIKSMLTVNIPKKNSNPLLEIIF